MPRDKTGDYGVGYGRPPRHTRFAKGQSGNPRGRPCGAKNFMTLLEEALDELVTVTGSSRASSSSVLKFLAPRGRPRGLPDWPLAKRVCRGGLP